MKTTLLFLALLTSPVCAQWFEPESINCIALIEKQDSVTFEPHGVAFAIGVRLDTTSTFYNLTMIVTNKHILSRPVLFVSIPIDTSLLRKSTAEGINRIIYNGRPWDIVGQRLRTSIRTRTGSVLNYATANNDSADVAAFPLEIPMTIDVNGLKLRGSTLKFIPISWIGTNKDIEIGTETYFLGFPRGYGSADPISPVLRSTTIAWVHPNGREFWLDAVSLGGNSGSPVFAKPIIGLGLPQRQVKLLGMVFGHFGERANLFLADSSGRPVVSEVELQNFQLAQAVSVDEIMQAVGNAIKLPR